MEIRCPQCDAVIKTGIEHKVVKCPYCSTNLYFKKDKVITKESIKPSLEVRVAENLLYEQTGKKSKLNLEYFPFYRIKTDEETIFIPGKKIDLIGIKSYIPQGDRITLEIEVRPPEISINEALDSIGEKEVKSIGLIYLPFFTCKDEDTTYYIDGVRGKILSNSLGSKTQNARNHYPFALISFGIITAVSLFFPTLAFRLISVITITFLLWYYDKGKQNG